MKETPLPPSAARPRWEGQKLLVERLLTRLDAGEEIG
jgi:hypothetical protein